jgi:hypothetical protein
MMRAGGLEGGGTAVSIGASLGCAAHCLLMPLAPLLFPAAVLESIHHASWERGALAVAVIAGLAGLCHRAQRHGQWIALAGFAGAVGLVAVGHASEGCLETALIAVGALGMALSQYVDCRLCQGCGKGRAADA